MKILLVNKFHYRRGGSETYYFSLAEALISRGYEVVFFSMNDDKNFECDQSKYFVDNVNYNSNYGIIRQVKSGAKLIYSKEAKKKIEQLIIEEKPDIAHLNLVHRQITLSIVDVLSKYNIPVVFTIHDLICICPNYTMISRGGLCEKCISGKFLNCVMQKCVKNSTSKSALAALEASYYKFAGVYNKIGLYISPSDSYRRKHEQSCFTMSPIIHLKNSLPMDTAYELPAKSRDYLLYFGRLSPQKGIMTLLKAVTLVGSGCSLYIVGNGPQQQEIQNFISKNQLQDRVKLLGFKTGDVLQSLVAESKCVILPSEGYENGPYSVMEAMAKGRPIIASHLGGLPELVEDGFNGYIFEAENVLSLKDKIERLLSLSEREYFDMCQASLNRAKQEFDPEKYVDRLVIEYKKLLEQAGRNNVV